MSNPPYRVHVTGDCHTDQFLVALDRPKLWKGRWDRLAFYQLPSGAHLLSRALRYVAQRGPDIAVSGVSEEVTGDAHPVAMIELESFELEPVNAKPGDKEMAIGQGTPERQWRVKQLRGWVSQAPSPSQAQRPPYTEPPHLLVVYDRATSVKATGAGPESGAGNGHADRSTSKYGAEVLAFVTGNPDATVLVQSQHPKHIDSVLTVLRVAEESGGQPIARRAAVVAVVHANDLRDMARASHHPKKEMTPRATSPTPATSPRSASFPTSGRRST